MAIEQEYVKKICPYCKAKNQECNIVRVNYANYIQCRCTGYQGELSPDKINLVINSRS